MTDGAARLIEIYGIKENDVTNIFDKNLCELLAEIRSCCIIFLLKTFLGGL